MREEHEWDGEDESDGETETIRAKWLMDGAATLSEAAQKLRDYADDLIKMERDGWQLVDVVGDDNGTVERSTIDSEPA
jgi:hypothetical protein